MKNVYAFEEALKAAGQFSGLRVAIVHHWLVAMRGGEKLLESLLDIFPQADIFTHVYDPTAISPRIRQHRIQTSFIQRLPWARKMYQSYLPLMPIALEELDLRGYDLIISQESGPSKGIIPPAESLHICYCNSPMRYLWNMYTSYKESAGTFKRTMMVPLTHYLRQWDVTSSARVDEFVSNSAGVAARVNKYYRRSSRVVYPPVDVSSFSIGMPEDFYLCCSQLVPYKRIDLAIEACNKLGRRLVVIGAGGERKKLSALAGPTVTFLGGVDFETLKDHYSRCRALIFPGEEDFGIVPVEAMASGRPVIGLGKGGLRDTVIDGVTGILYNKESLDNLIESIRRFERLEAEFDPTVIVKHAQRFGKERFMTEMIHVISDSLNRKAFKPDHIPEFVLVERVI